MPQFTIDISAEHLAELNVLETNTELKAGVREYMKAKLKHARKQIKQVAESTAVTNAAIADVVEPTDADVTVA